MRRFLAGWGDSGVVAVVLALLLPVLLGFVGLVVDLGFAFQYKRIMQTAADAGAYGGAYSIQRKEYDQVTKNALYDASKNGFDGSRGETRTVNNPPSGGKYSGNSDFVEMIISEDLPTYFMPVLGIRQMTIRARAVAGVFSAAACVYVLDGTSEKSFEISSASELYAPRCIVKVHSCHEEALSVTSASALTSHKTEVCGQANLSGSTVIPDPNLGVCDGTPCQKGADPLAYMKDPVPPPGCDFTDFKTSSKGKPKKPVPIDAGTYCNGISIESGSHVYFKPGIYWLKGGGLNIDSGSSASGSDLAFYNTEGEGYSYKPIEVQSGSEVTLKAMQGADKGDFDGMLFWVDRSVEGDYDNKIESNTKSSFEGTFLFTNQHLMFHSNTVGESGASWTLIVANTLEISSNTTVAVGSRWTNLSIQEPVLVE